MSRDHDWGCRLNLLVDAPGHDTVPQIRGLLERELPESYQGYPVRFPVTWDSSFSHKVDAATVASFATSGTGPTAASTRPSPKRSSPTSPTRT